MVGSLWRRAGAPAMTERRSIDVDGPVESKRASIAAKPIVFSPRSSVSHVSLADKVIDFLRTDIDTSHKHSKGSLIDHLIGVHALLQDWECPARIALAGLTHSVYGTEKYSMRSLSLSREGRETLRKQIGAESEELVFLFAIMDRAKFLASLGKQRVQCSKEALKMLGALDSKTQPLSAYDISKQSERDLCEILLANRESPPCLRCTSRSLLLHVPCSDACSLSPALRRAVGSQLPAFLCCSAQWLRSASGCKGPSW